MSIIIYTGKPGSGKTYRVVKELLEETGRYYVFHNIDGLKESMIEGGKYIQSWVGIEGFLTKKKQEEISTWAKSEYGRAVLVIVDEAQMVMADRNPEIKAWLSWHRHLGQDVKLICQHFKMISPDLYALADYEIRGKRGYLTSQLVYQWGVNGETFKTDRIKQSKAVFAAYRSFIGGEVNKGRSKLLFVAIGGCCLAVFMAVYVLGFGIPSVFANIDAKNKKVVKGNQKEVVPTGRSEKKISKVPLDPFIESLKKVSFAGCVGSRVLVQNVDDLQVFPLSDLMNYEVLECSGRGALLMTKEKGLLRLNVRGSRYIAASKIKETPRATVPPALARGGGDG